MDDKLDVKNDELAIKDKFCETMYELIRSKDFKRIFGIVLKQVGMNEDYFLGVLDKIKEGEELKKEEKDLFLELLDNKLFQEKGKEIVKRLKGFTLEEIKEFLKKYPTEKVIEHLKGVVNNEILDIPGFKYGVEIIESKEIGGENYLKLRIKLKDGEIKYCWKKEKDIKNLKEEDFIFDNIWSIKEIDGKIYYKAELNGKWGYVELGKEKEAEKKCIFSYVSNIKEINGKLYYEAQLTGKWGYIELGKEEKVEKKYIFDGVIDIKEINGKLYYEAELNDKWGYVELGKEEKAIIKYDLFKMSELKEDKKGVYFYYGGIFRRKIYVDKD